MSVITTTISTFVASILIILFVIGVHEFGHFVVAKCFKIHVERFSIGFGRSIYSVQSSSGTEYRFGLIPLGGYVRLLNERHAPVPEHLQRFAFNRQVIWKRIAVIGAGPFFNFVFAIVLFWLVNVIGFYNLKPTIGEVKPNSIAEQAGIQPGDTLTAIDNWTVTTWQQAYFALIYYLGDKDKVMVSLTAKDNQKKLISLSLEQWNQEYVGKNILTSLGIEPLKPTRLDDKIVRFNQYSISQGLSQAMVRFYHFIEMNSIVVYKVLIGKLGIQIFTGPIGLLEGALKSFELGWIPYLFFMAYISLAIGFMNLLPIPGLDGCSILYALIEKIQGRPISVAVEILAFRLGMIAIALLLVHVILNDLQRMLVAS